MKLTRFIGRRLALGVLSLAVFLFLLYVLIEALIPGDIVTPLRMGMTGDEIAELRRQMGLDRALPIRFWRWFSAVVTGDLATGGFRNAGRTIFSAFPATLLVFVIGLAIAYSGGSWLGRRTAWTGGAGASSITLVGVILYTLFPPFLAFILDRWLTDRLHDLRVGMALDPFGSLWEDTTLTENDVMLRMVLAIGVAWLVVAGAVRLIGRRPRRTSQFGRTLAVVVLTVLGWRLLGIATLASDLLIDAAIPIIGFAMLSFGEFLLITQAAMATTMHEDYVVTARAKGLPEVVVRDAHAARNASLVAFTRMAVSLPYLLTGLVIIETAVRWPGVGTFMFTAIETQDMPVVMSGLAMVGLVTMLTRLALDVVIAGSDPRVVVIPEAV